jgi:hypothetical protein
MSKQDDPRKDGKDRNRIGGRGGGEGGGVHCSSQLEEKERGRSNLNFVGKLVCRNRCHLAIPFGTALCG